MRVTSLINNAIAKVQDIPLVIFVDTNIPPSMAKRVFTKSPLSDELKKTLPLLGDQEELGLNAIVHIKFFARDNAYGGHLFHYKGILC